MGAVQQQATTTCWYFFALWARAFSLQDKQNGQFFVCFCPFGGEHFSTEKYMKKTYTHVYTLARARAHAQIHTHTCARAHTHTHTHTIIFLRLTSSAETSASTVAISLIVVYPATQSQEACTFACALCAYVCKQARTNVRTSTRTALSRTVGWLRVPGAPSRRPRP